MSKTSWKTTTLADTAKFEYLNGLWKGKKPPFEKAVVVRNTNFRNDGVLDLSDVAILDVEARQLKSRQLQRGDIIIERSGGGPKQPVGRVCYFNVNDSRPHSFSNFTTTLRVKDREMFLPLFVHYNLLHLYQTGFTFPLQRATTGIRNLDFGAYQEAVIPMPPKPEQEKIAAILWKDQRAIQVEEKLTATARELKQSAMHQLFTFGLHNESQRETEIGLIPKSWRIVECDSVCDMITVGIVVKPASHYVENAVPAFRSLNVREDRLDTSKIVFISKLANDTILSKSKLRTDDVLVIRTGYPGTSCVVPPEYNGANCIDLVIVRPRQDIILSAFLSRFFNSESGCSQALRSSTGLAQQHLNVGAVKRTLIPIPTIAEQKEIAAILQTIDRKISVHERKRATLTDLFQTLLHQLMTAQIRVDKLDIDTREVTA